ncbi:MAG: hypothetical protein M1833_006166 [Piccolia ochrophora]|nr:MAG: hypothetical protein M1833_006166 [Piccolia ochrophora]
MMRRPGNTLALPRDSADFLTNTEEVPWHVAAEVMDYARVMKGGEDYVNAQLDQEIEHLQQQEHEDEVMYGDDPEWTKKAVNAIREAKQRTQGIGNPPDMPRQPLEARVTRRPIQFHANNDNVPDMYLVQHAARSGQSSSDGPSTPQSHTPHSTVSHPENLSVGFLPDQDLADHPADHGSGISSSLPSTTSTAAAPMVRTQPPNAVPSHHISELPYYFYQASLHYYLSPLDIRILKSAFGDFSSFPTTVLARVERVSTGHTVDEELRKRAKYLSHLPYGCEVGFLECDWTDIVSHEVLSRFDSEITKRRKRNQEKEAREEKERVRAEKDEEEKRYISARRKRPAARRESDLHNDLYRPTSPLRDNVSSSIDISNASVSPPWSSNSRHHTGSAFAPLASPSSSPETARTVWGTAAIAPSSPQIAVQAPEVESSENDGWLQGWEKDLMQEDDLVAQVQAATLAEGSAQGANQGNVTKKKKGKKITLMSTNVRRGA